MSEPKKSSLGLFTNLSVMMFVLFFVWGAWFVTVGAFMFDRGMTSHIAWAYSTTPIAAIVTPFFMGVFADRFMNAEKLQGILMILSGVFIAIAPEFATPEKADTFILILLAHALCFMPNLGLSNTICLKHLKDTERDYPIVRVFATLGWIVAGLVVSKVLKADLLITQFYVAAGAAFTVGIYSFFLPKTPPPAKGEKIQIGDIYGAATIPYFKNFAFAVFMFASLFACVAFMPYWANGATFLGAAGIKEPGAFLTMGQMAELFILAFILPFFIKRFGIKWTMILGMGSWVIRYLCFSYGAKLLDGSGGEMVTGVMPLLIAGVVLHGFAYDFVFVSGYLYVDKHVSEKVRAQAQGLLTVFTQGIGFVLSSQIFAGAVFLRIVGDTGGMKEWKVFWLAPMGYLGIIFVLFLVLFKEDKPKTKPAA
ncbi:MAG: MFS transporter [Limisphaerales bacterium]